jgi:pyruvate formate lyase activating enzyme
MAGDSSVDSCRSEGIVFNFQHFSIHDGPGIRTTMFVKGCPLHCPWCSNPESINPVIQIKRTAEKCAGCRKCSNMCKSGALLPDDGEIRFDRSRCNDCLACFRACNNGCITTIGYKISAEEAASRLLKDKPFYDNTNGGVTISGGEPLFQHEFISDVFMKLHEQGVHTALDTSGFAAGDVFSEVIRHVDLVLFDIKHLNRGKHLDTIGADNEIILKNLRSCSGQVQIWTRTPLIPGFNDDFELSDAIVDLSREVGARRCCFLPLHQWGKHKYARLGLPNPYEHLREFSADELSMWKERYRDKDGFVFFETA